MESLSLGGITNGVTNLELTAAYATIADKGTYKKPRFYTKILDHSGNVLINNAPDTHTVLKETTAFLLTDAMKDVLTKGTGTAANFSNMPTAGKTGTTTKNRDVLFSGYTPYYTCSVWCGYDDNSPQDNALTGNPKKLWKNIMGRIHEQLPQKDFEKPEGIVTAEVCKKSGKLAVEGLCDADPRGSMFETEYFAAGTAPTEYCDHHVSATICTKSGMLANEYCPKKLRQTGVYIVGGSANTEDEPYLLSGDLENEKYCTIHTLKTLLPKIPQIPGIKDMENSGESNGTEGNHTNGTGGNPEDTESPDGTHGEPEEDNGSPDGTRGEPQEDT